MRIESFFSSLKNANEAASKLKEIGVEKAFVDANSHYVEDKDRTSNVPGTETGTSLSGVVLESDDHGIGENKAPLNAASPMVSGIGGFEEIANENCKVVAEFDEGRAEEVKQVIKQAGGTLDDPNVRKPRLESDLDIIKFSALDEVERKDLY